MSLFQCSGGLRQSPGMAPSPLSRTAFFFHPFPSHGGSSPAPQGLGWSSLPPLPGGLEQGPGRSFSLFRGHGTEEHCLQPATRRLGRVWSPLSSVSGSASLRSSLQLVKILPEFFLPCMAPGSPGPSSWDRSRWRPFGFGSDALRQAGIPVVCPAFPRSCASHTPPSSLPPGGSGAASLAGLTATCASGRACGSGVSAGSAVSAWASGAHEGGWRARWEGGPPHAMLGRLTRVFWKVSQSFLEGLESQGLQLGLHVCPVAHGWLP